MSAFEIEWDGQVKVPMHTLRIALTRHEERNQSVGSMDLTYRCDPTAVDLIPKNTMVGVWDGSERIFYGEALRGPVSSKPDGGHTRSVRLVDAWHQLQRSTYHRGDYADDTILEVDNPGTAQVSELWDYLREYGTEYMTSHLTWPAFADTGLPEVWHLAVQGLNNVQVSSNLATLLGNYPLACQRWNHATTPPAMVIKPHNAESYTLEMGSGVIEHSVAPNDGSRCRAFAVRRTFPWLEGVPEITEPVLNLLNEFIKSAQWNAFPPSEPKGGPGIMCMFLQDYLTYGIPFGAESTVYNYLNQEVWSGPIVLKGTDWPIKVGTAISIANDHPDLADMAMPVQSISKDYAAERTTLTVGPGPSLSAETLMEKWRAFALYNRWRGVLIPGSVEAPE